MFTAPPGTMRVPEEGKIRLYGICLFITKKIYFMELLKFSFYMYHGMKTFHMSNKLIFANNYNELDCVIINLKECFQNTFQLNYSRHLILFFSI